MLEVGIDAISFYTSNFFVDLAAIAHARNIDVDKYYVGIGQQKMAIPAVDEDVVTLAANAAKEIVNDKNRDSIHTLLFATESGIDQSKAAGVFVHDLIGLNPRCRVVELKQACYSSTAAIQLGIASIHQNPNQKVLVIASDIARYGLNTPGEPSQGCGAVAIVLSANPAIMKIDPENGIFTQDIMDFWRPNYRDEALVEGKYSSKMFLTSLENTWQQYRETSNRNFKDHTRFCYHTPVPRLAEKAHKALHRLNEIEVNDKQISNEMHDALLYNRTTGNCYTAALFISLISLLDNCQENLEGKRIGLFSYGSGSVAEFYSGTLVDGYHSHLLRKRHQAMLANRTELSYEEYKRMYSHQLPIDGSDLELPKQQTGTYRLQGMRRHKRVYEKA